MELITSDLELLLSDLELNCKNGIDPGSLVAMLLFKVVFTVYCFTLLLPGIDEITNCTCLTFLRVQNDGRDAIL